MTTEFLLEVAVAVHWVLHSLEDSRKLEVLAEVTPQRRRVTGSRQVALACL